MNKAPKPNRPLKKRGPVRDARSSVLASWRGVDLSHAEEARKATGQPVMNVMPAVLKALGLDRRRSEAEIAKVWGHLMDPNVAAHAHPTGVHKGTLFVSVDSSVWLNEIVRYRRKEILDRLQQSFGREFIARISFRVG